MVGKYLESAWNIYKKNFLGVVGAHLLSLLTFFSIAITAFAVGIYIDGRSVAQNIYILEITWGIKMFLLGLLIAILVVIPIRTGIVGFYANLLANKKTSMDDMLSIAKKKWRESIGSSLITVILMLILSLILILPTAKVLETNIPVLRTSLFAEVIVIGLFGLLFSLKNQAIVLANSGAVESVRMSIKIVKASYLQFLMLSAVLLLASVLISSIPRIGAVINMALFPPIMELAYTAFYMDKAGKKKAR